MIAIIISIVLLLLLLLTLGWENFVNLFLVILLFFAMVAAFVHKFIGEIFLILLLVKVFNIAAVSGAVIIKCLCLYLSCIMLIASSQILAEIV